VSLRLPLAIAMVASMAGSIHARVEDGQVKKTPDQWLIESVQGRWEVRHGGKQPHSMNRFDVLTAQDSVRCLSLPCQLMYATPEGRTRALPLPTPASARLNKWLSVPTPTGSPAGPSAAALYAVIGKLGTRGGRQKASPTCSGDLPLLAPTCGELIDPIGFTVQWAPIPTQSGKALILLVSAADSSEKKRSDPFSVDALEYSSPKIDAFLSGLELPDRPVDVTIRLMRTESLDAIRMVHLPSKADDVEYRKKITALSTLPPLSQRLALMHEYLTRGMWTKSAEVSQQLLKEAPYSLEMEKFAIVGFCHSDFAGEIARLRTLLKEAGVKGLCDSN